MFKEVIMSMMVWISVNSNLPNPYVIPDVILTSQDQLRNGSLFLKDSDIVAGSYDNTINQIRLPYSFDINSDHEKSALLHEIVHYMQDMDGRYLKYECINKAEPLAYKLEEKWRYEHHLHYLWNDSNVKEWSRCTDLN